MGVESLFKVFFVQATTLTGEGIPGVSVKLYSPLGADVTAQFAGGPNPVTNSQGVVSVYHENPVTAGGVIYTIRLTKRGWETLEFTTNDGLAGPLNFTGYGFYNNKVLTKSVDSGNQYKVSLPSTFVSPIYPIGFELESTTDERDNRIITTVAQTVGRSSDISTDIDEAGTAYIDVHNRIRLKPIPVAVPDGVVAIEDHYFSDVVTVEVKAETQDGFLTIPLNTDPEYPPTLELYAANMYPDGNVNDLYSYVPDYVHLSKWITLLEEPICFVGYYLDVMVWLPPPAEVHQLIMKYYDAADNLLTDSNDEILASPFVQRVRVNENPPLGSAYVTMQVWNTIIETTEVLTVRYNYGT